MGEEKRTFLCRMCGLPNQLRDAAMHDGAMYKGKNEWGRDVDRCRSGLQDVCEAGVWYVYWHEPERIRTLISELEVLRGYGRNRPTLESLFVKRIAEAGEFRWANAVTMFFRLNGLNRV